MSETNARKEFLEHVQGKEVLCAKITMWSYDEQDFHVLDLKQRYTENDYIKFICELNFMYDQGSGIQNLFGTIWYTDGTWSSREEYDGSEWWLHNIRPDVPQELLP